MGADVADVEGIDVGQGVAVLHLLFNGRHKQSHTTPIRGADRVLVLDLDSTRSFVYINIVYDILMCYASVCLMRGTKTSTCGREPPWLKLH